MHCMAEVSPVIAANIREAQADQILKVTIDSTIVISIRNPFWSHGHDRSHLGQ